MKRSVLILVTLAIFAITVLSGCKKTVDLTENISRLRADVLFGSNDDFALTAYPETRERPLIADGSVSPNEQVVILKLKALKGQEGKFQVKFTTDKEYTLDFSFSAYSDCFVASVSVEKLPYKQVNATICHNDDTVDLTLCSLLKADTVTPERAVKSVCEHKKEYIEQNSASSTFKGEVYVRLICENDKNFWYVGLITKEKTLALLVDGKTGKILSEKSLINTLG